MMMEQIKEFDLQRAHKLAAEAVVKYGDIYLPLFERLNNELQKQSVSKQIKELALSIACAKDILD